MTRAAAPTTPAVRVTWIADRDGVSHAHAPRAARTRCDRPAIDRRFAWPSLRLCEACVAAIETSTKEEAC